MIAPVLTKKQEEQITFHLEEGGIKKDGTKFTRADLLPSNKWNSVRYEWLSKSDHFLHEEDRLWECHQGCGYTVRQHIVYFVSFGDAPTSVCIDTVRVDDNYGVGTRASTAHLFGAHPDFTTKKLKKMGMSK